MEQPGSWDVIHIYAAFAGNAGNFGSLAKNLRLHRIFVVVVLYVPDHVAITESVKSDSCMGTRPAVEPGKGGYIFKGKENFAFTRSFSSCPERK